MKRPTLSRAFCLASLMGCALVSAERLEAAEQMHLTIKASVHLLDLLKVGPIVYVDGKEVKLDLTSNKKRSVWKGRLGEHPKSVELALRIGSGMVYQKIIYSKKNRTWNTRS